MPLLTSYNVMSLNRHDAMMRFGLTIKTKKKLS